MILRQHLRSIQGNQMAGSSIQGAARSHLPHQCCHLSSTGSMPSCSSTLSRSSSSARLASTDSRRMPDAQSACSQSLSASSAQAHADSQGPPVPASAAPEVAVAAFPALHPQLSQQTNLSPLASIPTRDMAAAKFRAHNVHSTGPWRVRMFDACLSQAVLQPAGSKAGHVRCSAASGTAAACLLPVQC